MKLQKEFCLEAMRLNYLLIKNEETNLPFINALFSLMCFHSSRFDARLNENGESILYQHQDETLWNKELIERGEYYLDQAFKSNDISRYHLQAAIAFHHTKQTDNPEKWNMVLQLYNQLLQLEYSPIVALNRTYALAKVQGKAAAIVEAEKLNLSNNHLYYSLLGDLYTNIDDAKAIHCFQTAWALARSTADKAIITNKIIDCGREKNNS